MENRNKEVMKSMYIIPAVLGMTIALLWQFGSVFLKEGPVADALKKARKAAPVNTSWEYRDIKDKATGVTIKAATLNSTNMVDTGLGPSRMHLILLECSGKNEIEVVSSGVPLCLSTPEQCSVTMTLDDGSVEKVKASYVQKGIFLGEPEKLAKLIKSTKSLSVETIFVSSKGKFPCRFNFKTSGLSLK